MAEAIPSFYGWSFDQREDAHGHPLIEATKAGRPPIGEIGQHGIDPAIMLQRLKARLMDFETENAPASDRKTWEKRQANARRDRDEARAQRVALEGVRQQFAAGEEG